MRIPTPSPAMAVALVALVLSTTGTTIAATTILLPRGSVASAQIRDRSIVLGDLTFSTITSLKRPSGAAGGVLDGTYPRPTFAAGAVGATALADGSVLASKIGDGVITGTKLADGSIGGSKIMSGSIDSSDLVANEPWTEIPLNGGWGSSSVGFYDRAAFRRDRFGTVQLKGVAWRAVDGGASNMFQLPAGYRPLKSRIYSIASGVGWGTYGTIEVEPDGDVYVYMHTNDANVSLDGISFVAGE